MRNKLIPASKFHYAKRQLLGQIAIASEYAEHLMLTTAKSYLLFNRVDTLQEISEKLDKIEPEQLRDIANDVFNSKQLNTLIYT